MSNILNTLNPILVDQKALFDFLVGGETSQNVDNLAMLDLFIKEAKKTLDEAKTYLGSETESVQGSSYELVPKTLGGESTIYNPHKIFQKLMPIDSSLARQFISNVKVTKTDVEAFARVHDLKIKDFADCCDDVTKSKSISYYLKLKK